MNNSDAKGRADETSGAARTSREIWLKLQSHAGLTISTGEGNVASYDDAFVQELRNDLFGGEKGDFAQLLEHYAVPPERLLTSFFRALAPYPRMAGDILKMFETASAKRSNANLRLAVDVDGIDTALEFDLSAFRETVRKLDSITVLLSARQWNVDNASSIDHAFARSGLIPGMFSLDAQPSPPLLESEALRDWIAAMKSGHRFPKLPPPPVIGHAVFDKLAGDLWFDFQDFHTTARELYGSYDKIVPGGLKEDVCGWDRRLLSNFAHDFWPQRTVHLIGLLGDILRRNPDDPNATSCLDSVIEAVAAFTLPPRPREELIETVEVILSLPVWQKRHEFYSVWVASLITNTLDPYLLDFHVHDATLAFPFRPVHFASFGSSDSKSIELWSELRSPAIDPVGRVAEVQPDYRIRWPEKAWTNDGTTPDVMIVECKQYRRSSTRNFSKALIDYARAAKQAKVLLVNYGPVGQQVLAAVTQDVAGRCHPIGRVFPGGDGLPEATDAIREIGKNLGPVAGPGWTIDIIDIELTWRGQGIDLDIFVTTRDAACGYDSPDGLPEVFFYGDDLGNGVGVHRELLTITPKTSERFDIVIRAHSGAKAVGEAKVSVKWRRGAVTDTRDFLVLADARDWHVASFIRGHSTPYGIDLPAQEFQSGRGWTSATSSKS